MNEFVIQGIGGVAVLCFVLSYQIKSIKKLFFFQMLANCFFILQFVLLHAYSGCFSLFLMVIRNVLMIYYYRFEWIRENKWVYVLIGLNAISLFFTWNGVISLLPFAAFTGGTLMYASNNPQKVRLINLICCCPCWLVYDFFIHSWTGMLNEIIMLCSIFISIYRYGWNELNNPHFGNSK